MKDFINIIKTYQNLTVSNAAAVLATVIGIEGNSFRRTGVRILIDENGQWLYEGESGMAEGNLLEQIQLVIKNNIPIIVDVDTSSNEGHQIGVALGYRGIIQLFLNPKIHHPIEVLQQCLAEPCIKILMTVIETFNESLFAAGSVVLYHSSNQLLPNQANRIFTKNALECAQEIWLRGRSATKNIDTNEGQVKVFCEIITPQPQLVLLGSQYDVYPLAMIAKAIGWKVIVLANPEKLRQSIFSLVDEVHSLDQMNQIKINQHTAFVIMSHLFDRDLEYLVASIKTTVPYIGMLGPRRRFERMFARLAKQDFFLSEADKARVHAPIGLDIGASTQEEMAVSIVTEIRAFFNGKKGGFLKTKDGDIHFR